MLDTMLSTIDWTQAATVSTATLGLVAVAFGAIKTVISRRNGRPAPPADPEPPPCEAHHIRLEHVEEETARSRETQTRIWQTLDEQGQRLARIEGGVGEIKDLLK